MNIPTRRRLAGTAAAVVLLLTPALTAAAHAATTPPDDFAVEGPAFAQLRGITLAEADQRLGWQQLAPTLADNLAADLPTRFGGLWIDYTHDDRVKIGITGTIDRTTGAAVTHEATAVGLTTGYDMVSVVRTEATLQSDMAWLSTQIAQANTGATVFLSAGERTDLNQLQLEAPPASQLTAAQATVVTTAQARLGTELVTVAAGDPMQAMGCTYPFCDPPLRGGVRIALLDGTGCTLGFNAASKVDGKPYIITAGHCVNGKDGMVWHTSFANGADQTIGAVWHGIWGGNADESIISDSNAATWNPQGRVQVTNGVGTTADPDYFIKADHSSVLGQRICDTGSFALISYCAFVVELNATRTYGGQTVSQLGITNGCAVHGDSGAPMYATHFAFGILVAGTNNCQVAYVGIHNIENALNVNILTATS